jgi:hypothetical protein
MTMAAYLVVAIVLVAGIIALVLLFRRYAQLRGSRVVTCPETKEPVGVEVDAGRAAVTSMVGKPTFELTQCTRWPERRDCGRECLAQIETAPIDCLVRTKLAAWYEGKACATCGKPIGTIDWLQHRPGLLAPDRTTIGWEDVRAEQLGEVLATHRPVCWDCHVTEKFRREYPELVLDNPWQKADTRSTSH